MGELITREKELRMELQKLGFLVEEIVKRAGLEQDNVEDERETSPSQSGPF